MSAYSSLYACLHILFIICMLIAMLSFGLCWTPVSLASNIGRHAIGRPTPCLFKCWSLLASCSESASDLLSWLLCTHSTAFLHLHRIHIARMHQLFKNYMLFASSRCWTPAVPASNVGRRYCYVQCLQLVEPDFKTPIWFHSPFFVFYRFLYILLLPCMLPDPRFGFAPRLARFPVVFALDSLSLSLLHIARLHRFLCFYIISRACIIFHAFASFSALTPSSAPAFALSLACRLHRMIFVAVLFYRLHLH